MDIGVYLVNEAMIYTLRHVYNVLENLMASHLGL
jgi:hypothetical protein